jgi:hypothetical protein
MTERLADVLSTSLTGHRLTPSQTGHSGRAIHYAFGMSTGWAALTLISLAS